MTFREKSAIAQIATIVLVYGFVGLKLWGRPLPLPAAIVTVIGLSVLMIVIVTVSHIALVIHRRPEKTDERDAQVALRSTRNGYYTLAVGLWFLMMLAIQGPPVGQLFLTIMYVGVLGELVRLTSQVVYYRRAL
jgi:preprotein translocase subunit SecF